MAKCGKEILSKREGTAQLQRYIEALDPASVKLNDFRLKEWMQFAYTFAQHINYFNTINHEVPSANWQDFFIKDEYLEDFLNLVDDGKVVTPHLALFVSFIKLLEFSKKRFNKLTKRHLDFYYRRILQIEKLPATPDKVHMIFELAKNVVDEKIAQETELDGGKDAAGLKRIYKTTEELVANKSTVSKLMSVYNDHANSKLKAATVANSYDGTGGGFPNDEIKWWPFGYYGDVKYPELPDAKVGFAVSGEILELQEGQRNVLITVEFKTNIESITSAVLRDNLEVYCSGEKKWLGPFTVQPTVSDSEGQAVFSSELSSSKKILTFAFQIPKEEEPVIDYNSEVLGEKFISQFPVCRVLFKTENTDGFELYRKLVEKEINTCKINIDVRGVKSLSLESDIGTLNAEKPFYPFSTQPVKKSNFYVDYPELFKKNWKTLDFEIEWKNTPDSFKELYYAYRESYRYKLTPEIFLDIMGNYTDISTDTLEQIQRARLSLETNASTAFQIFEISESDLIVENDSHFKADIQILNKEEWETVDENAELFETKDEDGVYKMNVSVSNTNYEEDKNGPVRLSLKQSFLHELFPRIYALAFSSEESGALIPNEPYTPMVETITLNYKAETNVNLGTTREAYQNNQVLLFHEHPFGQSEEHPYLKNQFSFLAANDKKEYLVPTYCKGGELYIGLANVKNLQQISLLVQVLEGSENPLADSFTGKQKAEWSVLCNNEWKRLDSNYMVSNQTDNFLKSGIVKFSVPKETTQNNTKLPSGQVWVKVKIHKNYDAVCKAISIQAQAVLAEFAGNGNDLSHLENGLEAGTISKLIQRVATVKGVSQPFSSFGGKPEESDDNYYRRVSERLRHKNRAIALWDYEHIVLQEFPEIHKVKCLNHSSETTFLSPGDVLVVVIPDIVNKNVFDIYQPRVSKATLNKIQNHINKLNSFHVNAKVINPDYEEVTVDLKVKFYEGYDENYYLKVLNEDITRLLSPWAFEETASIEFGVTLHLSLVINYIEKLKYVDYVEDVKLKKGTESNLNKVTPSSPKTILVSAKQHNLSTDIKSCTEITETEETCQT
jgi:hypothetical protein